MKKHRMPSLITILGLVATIGLLLFYIPQVLAIHRAQTLLGFSLPAWGALWVAVTALVVQAAILGIWTAVTANTIGIGAVVYVIVQVLRKGDTVASK